MSGGKRTINGATRSSRLLQALPELQVLRCYDRKNLGPDVLAGFVIVLVLIPSALAYAEIAGSGPANGRPLIGKAFAVREKSRPID